MLPQKLGVCILPRGSTSCAAHSSCKSAAGTRVQDSGNFLNLVLKSTEALGECWLSLHAEHFRISGFGVQVQGEGREPSL